MLCSGENRTISGCLKNFECWGKSGSKKKDTKRFKSCIHQPIFQDSENEIILYKLPPPELHLMLGAVNSITNNMLQEVESTANDFFRKCNVHREVRRGCTGFDGNSCRNILKKIDELRKSPDIRCLKYVRVLKDLDNVVKDCFGKELKPSYKASISQFKKSYLDLDISVTPKIHAIFFHVPKFCETMNVGLGVYSEQAFESVHHDFNVTWAKYKVKLSHPNYDVRLLQSIVEYDSHHI